MRDQCRECLSATPEVMFRLPLGVTLVVEILVTTFFFQHTSMTGAEHIEIKDPRGC